MVNYSALTAVTVVLVTTKGRPSVRLGEQPATFAHVGAPFKRIHHNIHAVGNVDCRKHLAEHYCGLLLWHGKTGRARLNNPRASTRASMSYYCTCTCVWFIKKVVAAVVVVAVLALSAAHNDETLTEKKYTWSRNLFR